MRRRFEEAAHGVAVVAAIADQAFGLPADRLTRERFLEERDLRRGRRVQVLRPAEYPRHRPVPSTSCPYRAWWGRFWRPFFRWGEAAVDEALVPAEFLRSLSSFRNARRRVRSTPRSSHCRSRRQQVVGLPYRRGSSLHGAPVQRIHGPIRSHCAPVNARHAMPPRYRPLPHQPKL